MVRLFGRPETRTYALQLLPLHFPVSARCLDWLFRAGPVGPAGTGNLAGAGVAGVLRGEWLAICRPAAGVDLIQLPDRLAADRAALEQPSAMDRPDRRRQRRSRRTRLLQICRLPRYQSQRAVIEQLYRRR